MKKFLGFLFTLFLVLGFLLMPTTSMALMLVDGTDVGTVDTFIGSATKAEVGSSGDQDELDWVNSVLESLGVEEHYMTSKEDTPDGYGWEKVYTDEKFPVQYTYAHSISYDTEYFLVKTGNNDNTEDQYFLYNNISNLNWAVINLNVQSITNLEKLSHIDTFDIAPVPEPATMLLLGAGLVGLAGFRKKIKK